MASDTEDPEAAADRLEAALERIAEAATRDGGAAGRIGCSDAIPKKLLRNSTA